MLSMPRLTSSSFSTGRELWLEKLPFAVRRELGAHAAYPKVAPPVPLTYVSSNMGCELTYNDILKHDWAQDPSRQTVREKN
jgi:hypothetical protein